ncbi:MAG: hypothetical protein HY471_03105 [Candidatus Sungbacteria bacterium]|nr:hypothetical protein [Candidatus Sungbacteria bacterium]
MTQNPFTQSIETKLYFVVLVLFAVFAGLIIYNSSLDTIIANDEYYGHSSALNVKARTSEAFEN